MPKHAIWLLLSLLTFGCERAFGLNLADAAEEDLKAAKETDYQHKSHVDKAAGVFELDCSGFVDHLLKQSSPQQFSQLPIEAGHTRPRVESYYELFAGLEQNPKPGWEAIRRFSDLRRGDIIAWKKELAANETGDTGHVMIVAGPPTRRENSSYRVTVYDSTKTPHDNDTRAPGTDGIGRGDLFFYVNGQDAPVAFQFASQRKVHEAPIAMGRPTQ
jgi:hypothetical protein